METSIRQIGIGREKIKFLQQTTLKMYRVKVEHIRRNLFLASAFPLLFKKKKKLETTSEQVSKLVVK